MLGEGPYLFIPVLGPSNPRDLTGFGVGIAADPLTWFGQGFVVEALTGTRAGATVVDTREDLLDPLDAVERTSLDPYATLRSAYRQRRRAEIRNQAGGGAAAGVGTGFGTGLPSTNARTLTKQEILEDMLSRRFLLGAAAAGSTVALAGSGLVSAHAADPARAAHFIRSAGQELIAAVDSIAPVAQRRQNVMLILRRAVDIDGVGRFVLGRWWRAASAAERQEYLRLFEEALLRNLSARFGEYQGARFSLGRVQERTENDVPVNTIIDRPGSTPISLDWRVGDVSGQPRVVDLVAEGTSLRLTQRSEYSAVIQRGNGEVSALLAAMRDQVQQLAVHEQR